MLVVLSGPLCTRGQLHKDGGSDLTNITSDSSVVQSKSLSFLLSSTRLLSILGELRLND